MLNVTGTGFDTVSATEIDVERGFTPLSVSAGLVLSPGGGWVLALNAQRVERAPTFSDFIYKRFTGELCDDDFSSCTVGGVGAGTELDQVFFTQTDATFKGFEAGGRVTLARWGTARAGLTGQFDMVRADLDGGANVPRIPPMRVGSGVFYEDDNVAGTFGFLHAFEQDRIAANETETGGYTNLKGEVRVRLPGAIPGKSGLEIALAGENLLDEEIRNHVSFKKDEVLQPGRNVRLVLTMRF